MTSVDETLVNVLKGTVRAVEAELQAMAQSRDPDGHTMHVLRSLRRQLMSSLSALEEQAELGPDPAVDEALGPVSGPASRRRP